MANNQPNSSGVRSDPGQEINPLRSIMPVDGKNFIVGKYDEWGHRKTAGAGANTGELSHITKLMNGSMKTRGGELMPGFIMTRDGPVKASQYTPRPQPKPPEPKSPEPKPVIKSKRGKKAKEEELPNQDYLQVVKDSLNIKPDQEPVYYEQVPVAKVETFPVTFEIESGTIRSNVDSVLEDELGLILVYKDVDCISYVPKKGGILTLALPGRKVEVMYLGIQLRWFDSDQQLLVFVKTSQA